MEASLLERLTEGVLSLVLMGRVMHSKSLIQFSVDGWGYVPSLLFDLKPHYGGGSEDNGTSFKKSHAHTAALNAPNSATGLCRTTLLPGTPGLLLSPGSWCAEGFVCALQESVSQACVSSGGSMMGLMATFSKRAYAIPRTTAPRAPALAAGHC